ncbi:MAG: hypothetical protein IJG33_13955 [Selenomonadaceae bacterium]|nr:hypothetical protein [Selenomonadaceae bacterium]
MNKFKDNFTTNLENLPQEILKQPRFFPVTITAEGKKLPCIEGWNEPKNQKLYSEIQGLAGFDVTGHGVADDYLFFDFDHVLDDNGEFISEEAEDWFTAILVNFNCCYCEKSISGSGIHIFAKPTPNKFSPISNGKNGVLYFDKANDIKLEVFYKTKGRYCLMTGNLFECDAQAPIPSGAIVDQTFQDVLNEIQKRLPKDQPKQSPTPARKKESFEELGNDYDLFRAQLMLEAINPADLSDTEWLAVNSACKNIGIAYPVVDAFNQRDTTIKPNGEPRYNEQENQNRWDSLCDPSFDIETLHGIAKRFGYEERTARREWYKLHPERSHKKSHARRADSTTPIELDHTGNSNAHDDDQPPADDDMEAYAYGFVTDLGNAERLERFCGKSIRWLTDAEKWLIWQPTGIWKLYSEKNSCLNPFVKQLADSLAKHARKLKNLKDDKSQERAKSFYGLSVTFQKAKFVNPAIFMLKGFDSILITREDLDRHKNLLNCLNGVVDLQTEKLYPHRAPDLITQQTRTVFRPGYRNPVVDNFLASIMPDEEVREALLRWLGYCLTGEISEQCAHFWTGDGSNGKSTLLDFLLYLLGTYATKLPVQAVVETREAEANATTTHLNCLVGRRLAVVNEFKPNHRLDVQQFKDLTGDKFLDIRRLHHERETIELLAKLILNGNELPRLNNADSYALNRRIRALRFAQTFSLDRGNLDPALPKKLATLDACAGMLSLLVPHAAAWYRDSESIGTGLLEAGAMKEAKTEYLSENDFIEEFFTENCTFANATAEIPIKDFEERLKAAFPYETMESRIRKKDLRAQIQAKALNHGATVAIGRGRAKVLKGVSWLLTAEFAGTPVDPRDIS